MERDGTLITDNQTDMLFDYFVNEDKFNEMMRPEIEEIIAKRAESLNVDPNEISVDPMAGKISLSPDTPKYKSLTAVRKSPSPYKSLVKEKRTISPYAKKVESYRPPVESYRPPVKSFRQESARAPSPIMPKESSKERRSRARDIHSKLMALVKRHKGKDTEIKLSRHFTSDDDPDDLQEELDHHVKELAGKRKLMFCKKVLIGGAGLLEFCNENFNPWEFDMEGLAKHISAESDDYDDVLEELIAKYSKDGKGNFPPEIRFVVMLMMSVAGFHMSKRSDGLGAMLKNNPGLAKQVMSMMGGKATEEEYEEPPPDNDAILSQLRQNRPDQSEMMKAKELAEQRAAYEKELRRREELHAMQLNDLRMTMERESLKYKSISPMKKSIKVSPKAENIVLNDILNDIASPNMVFNDDSQDNYKSYMTSEMPSAVYNSKPRPLDSIIESLEFGDDLFASASDTNMTSLSKRNGAIRV